MSEIKAVCLSVHPSSKRIFIPRWVKKVLSLLITNYDFSPIDIKNRRFGKFATTVIDRQSLRELQTNLIRSHAAGVGNPLPPERTRMLLALRINILAKGYSGISLENLERCVACFNASCLSWVPEKGTVGASGDLAPLSHLALGMMGEGKMWCPETGWGEAKYILESKGNMEGLEYEYDVVFVKYIMKWKSRLMCKL